MYGKRVKAAKAATPAACREQCQGNAACNAWMYWGEGSPHPGLCELVGTAYDMAQSPSPLKVISGIVRPRSPAR
jgi:hypothetical protein